MCGQADLDKRKTVFSEFFDTEIFHDLLGDSVQRIGLQVIFHFPLFLTEPTEKHG